MANRAALLALLAAFSLHAQEQRICESEGNRYNYCEGRIDGPVTLVDQLSRSACVEGDTWGYDAGGIWVDDGCRARFRIEPAAFGGAGSESERACQNLIADRLQRDEGVDGIRFGEAEQYRISRDEDGVRGQGTAMQRGRSVTFEYRCEVDLRTGRVEFADHQLQESSTAPQANSVLCESQGGRYGHCPVTGIRSASLREQLSRSECIEGRSWGVDAEGVWVDQGCRGRFDVQLGFAGGAGDDRSELVCESRGDRYQHCPADDLADVELVEQLSRTACIEGSTWGSDDRGVWVDRGCRARFAVSSRRQDPGTSGWDAVSVCHQELRRQARSREGVEARIRLEAPEILSSRQQQSMSGQGELTAAGLRQPVRYQCRADLGRRFLLEAGYEVIESAAPVSDATPLCQQEVLRQVRAELGGRVDLRFDTPEVDASRADQHRISGRAKMSATLRALDYSCRVDMRRRVILNARYDWLTQEEPASVPPAEQQGQAVDVHRAVEICKESVGARVLAERGHDKTINWGLVSSYAGAAAHQVRVAGRGGTFVGRRRDKTFEIECLIDQRNGAVLSADHRYR